MKFWTRQFYIELQDHGIEAQREINPMLIRISEETGIPLIATNDRHLKNQTAKCLTF